MYYSGYLCRSKTDPQTTTLGGVAVVRYYHLVGQLFLNALMCVVIPLVVTSVISSVAQMGADGSLRKLGKRIFSYFVLTSLLAVIIGFLTVMAIKPGSMHEITTVVPIDSSLDSFSKIEEFILKVVPSNIVMAAAQGQILGLILFSVLFGVFLSKVDADNATVILRFVKGVYQVMILMTRFIMRALPIGVFGLVAESCIATTGVATMTSALWFVLTVLAGYRHLRLSCIACDAARDRRG